MIRATRGRSRRPNHMRSQIGGPKAMRPVALRRLPGDFHSVAKQASFNIAFGVDLEGFWRPRWAPKFEFRALFFDIIFECVFASLLVRFLEALNVKNSNFPEEAQRFSQNRDFRQKCEKPSKNHPQILSKSIQNRHKIEKNRKKASQKTKMA